MPKAPLIESAYVSLDALTPHQRNYNRHSKTGVIERMADRMRMAAFTAPVVVDADNVLLGGHLRRLALLWLRENDYSEPEGVLPGWQVPARVFRGNEAQKLAVLLGDNPDSEDLEYDLAGLTSLLCELQQADALQASGYTDDRLEALLAELAVPDFEPSEGAQGQLDERAKVTCPECGHEFTP